MLVTEQVANVMKLRGDVLTEDGVDYQIIDAYPIYDGAEVELEFLSLDGTKLMYKRLRDVSEGVVYTNPIKEDIGFTEFEEEGYEDYRFEGDDYADLLR